MKKVPLDFRYRPPLPRRQFSLKTLLFITTAAAVSLGLLVERARRQREAAETVRRLHGALWYDDQLSGGVSIRRTAATCNLLGPRISADRAPGPFGSWLERQIGVDFVADVAYVDLSATAATDNDLAALRGLRRLRFLSLANTHITDAGLAQLAGCTALERLDLRGTATSDAGLLCLAPLKNLVELRLGSTMSTLGRLDQATQVSDAGLRRLLPFKQLKALDLGGTQIGDAGLHSLAALPTLEFVNLLDARTTAAGRRALRRARPGLWIEAGFDELASAP